MSSCISPGLTDALPPATWVEGPHGRLACYLYPASRPWLRMLVSHGFSEHSGWWHHVAVALREQGVSVCLFDHYHHGRSAGAVADVPDYARLVDGWRAVLEQAAFPAPAAPPLVALGHSSGALVMLLALQQEPALPVAGVALSSPFLEMPWQVAWGGTLLARLLRAFAPGWRVPLQSRPWRLTGCEAIWPQYPGDPLRFRSITARFFLAMRRAIRAARALDDLGARPLLLLSAGDEQVVSAAAIEAFYARVRAPDKTRRRFAGLRHELFNETAWQDVLGALLDWCRPRFDRSAAPAPRAVREA